MKKYDVNSEIPEPIIEEIEEEKHSRLNGAAVLAIILAAVWIIMGALITVSVFLNWQTCILYFSAGIGLFLLFGGIILIGMALTGTLD